MKISMKRRRRLPMEGADPPESSSSSASLSEYSSSSSSSFGFTSSSSCSSSSSEGEGEGEGEDEEETPHTEDKETSSKKRKRSRRHRSRKEKRLKRQQQQQRGEQLEPSLKQEQTNDPRARRSQYSVPTPHLPMNYFGTGYPMGQVASHSLLPPPSHDAFRAGTGVGVNNFGTGSGKLIRSIVRPTYKKITYYDDNDSTCSDPYAASSKPAQTLAMPNNFQPNLAPSYPNFFAQNGNTLPQSLGNSTSNSTADKLNNHTNSNCTYTNNPANLNTNLTNTNTNMNSYSHGWNDANSDSKKPLDHSTPSESQQSGYNLQSYPYMPTYHHGNTAIDPNIHYVMLRNAHLRTLNQIQSLYASMSHLAPNKNSPMMTQSLPQQPLGVAAYTHPNTNKPSNTPQAIQELGANSHNGTNDASSINSDDEDNIGEDGNESGYCGDDYSDEDGEAGSDQEYQYSNFTRTNYYSRPALFSTPSPISYASSSPSQSPCPSPSPIPSLSSSPSRTSSPLPNKIKAPMGWDGSNRTSFIPQLLPLGGPSNLQVFSICCFVFVL